MRAKDVMSSPVYTVSPDTPVESAAAVLTERSVTALPVVDAAGTLVGMVSEGDLLRNRVSADPTATMLRSPAGPDDRPAGSGHRPGRVAEVMTRTPVSTHPGADVAEIAESMLRHDIRSLPVLAGNDAVVGIVSRRDILRAMVRDDEVLTGEVQHRLDDYAGGARRWAVRVQDGVADIKGELEDGTERAVVGVLARTVPGVASVRFS